MEVCVQKNNCDQLTGPQLCSETEPVSVVEAFVSNHSRLKQIAGGLGFAGSDASDVLGDVSLEAVTSKRQFDDSGHALRWLIRVTVNRCFLETRKRARFKRAAKEMLLRSKKNSEAPLDLAAKSEELEIVKRTLKTLDESLLVPLVLKYYCNMNSVEIGKVLQVKPATVRSRLRNGRLALAKTLTDRGIQS
jgi:RNA polymerase sigma-70 factor (ECF subfamily)